MGKSLKATRMGAALAAAMTMGVIAAPTATAEGEFSANVALTTDYVWRGISQNDSNPAIMGGFDYSNGGFYVGTWAANVAAEGTLELDIYAGYGGDLGGGLSYDVGVIGYLYPGSDDLDFSEVYGGLSYESEAGLALGGSLAYDPDNESTYIEGTAGYAFTDTFGADVSVGNYSFDEGGDYTNFSIGGTLSTELVDFDLRFWGTDLDETGFDAVDSLYEERVVLTVSKSF